MLRSSEKKYTDAHKTRAKAESLIKVRVECGPATEEGRRIDSRLRRMVRHGYYEHFKSTKANPKFYRVYETLPHVNHLAGANAYQVTYRALYGTQQKKTQRELLGADGFLTPIDRNEYTGPRFVFRGTMRPKSV